METFSQYCVNGCFNYTTISIQDHPQYKHRGLMIDTGYVRIRSIIVPYSKVCRFIYHLFKGGGSFQ